MAALMSLRPPSLPRFCVGVGRGGGCLASAVVGRLDDGRRRTRARGAIIAHSARFSARFLCALCGGYGGADSLALGVSAVASVI